MLNHAFTVYIHMLLGVDEYSKAFSIWNPTHIVNAARVHSVDRRMYFCIHCEGGVPHRPHRDTRSFVWFCSGGSEKQCWPRNSRHSRDAHETRFAHAAHALGIGSHAHSMGSGVDTRNWLRGELGLPGICHSGVREKRERLKN